MKYPNNCEKETQIEHFLDIRNDVCPMTFVRTRLLIEKMSAGDTATILLRGEEPVENVPASVLELGHTVVNMAPAASAPAEAADVVPGDMRLEIRKE